MRLVLLDRDGVINRDSANYIRQLDDWQPIPGSLDAIARLSAQGWPIAICTNQSGVARGLVSRSVVDAIHQQLRTQVAARGGRVVDFFVCPHTDEAGCACRKPAPGLLQQACEAFGIAPGEAVFIGDSTRDLEAAGRAGVRPVLVRTGHGARVLAGDCAQGVESFPDLASAADALLRAEGEQRSEP